MAALGGTLKELKPSALEIIEDGLFSTISRCQIGSPPRWIAVKSASTHRGSSPEPHDIVKELRLLSGLNHPNIISVLGSQLHAPNSSLEYWMPYIPYKLLDLLTSPAFSPNPLVSFSFSTDTNPGASLKETAFLVVAKSIMYQLLLALAYLHTSSIAHRDVKPANVLITQSGQVQLIDFGIAWKQGESEQDKEHDLWKEDEGHMYFEVATGCYRAPELLFGPRTYNAPATDLWSLGALFAEFFTPLSLFSQGDDSDEDEEKDRTVDESNPKPFILPPSLRPGNPGTMWRRNSLFNAERGEIGLAWSIFKILGTPTDETWPTFKELPNASLVQFTVVPPVDLAALLPNLPPSSDGAFDILRNLVVYPQTERLNAAEALKHHWFAADPPALLPAGHLWARGDEGLATSWNGKSLSDWYQPMLPHRSPPKAQPRSLPAPDLAR
ncbi:hypothetical protein HWV62_7340 [Athelia sp. TMB]|nr:hypothetical protein HWV62_7340 [Athelia sp. TMB]